MLPVSKEWLNILWLRAAAARDPVDRHALLCQFRDALHEHMGISEQRPGGSSNIDWIPASIDR
jgi:hypothetical protein